jgi:hypothetical protein
MVAAFGVERGAAATVFAARLVRFTTVRWVVVLQTSIKILFDFGLSAKVLPSLTALDAFYLEYGLRQAEFDAVNIALKDHKFTLPAPAPATEDEFGDVTYQKVRRWPREKFDR